MTDISALAVRFIAECRAAGFMAVTAESCTGGMIAVAITDISGSSAVLDRGFVTYSNEAKMEVLGVSVDTLATHGAVSEQTAREMAAGALAKSRASIALSVTGIAGPGGGTAQKPVGLVWFGVAVEGRPIEATSRIFEDRGRAFIRTETVRTALELGIAALPGQATP
ncbi:MAG: CinA family protein [Aquamicrobium sp.]|uniref:CinA family protein n=1 Tax=Aquamicrobium sp. TaxID=1872579 RepID=UPI00349EF946|nr:CinA family protein [Aquamicrobium sp.]